MIVGHSMGGLAIRAWLRDYQAYRRVHHVITIGTPHRETWLARYSHAISDKQMQIGSGWLSELTASEPAWTPDRMTCFHSNCDNVVFPEACASLNGATSVAVPGLGHIGLMLEPMILKRLNDGSLAVDTFKSRRGPTN